MMAETAGQYRKDYSKTELFFGNLVIILWIGLGALSCALFYPLTAVLFFALAAFLIFYELGKQVRKLSFSSVLTGFRLAFLGKRVL